MFQNYLVLIAVKKYIKYFSATTWIDSGKSNRMWEENIEYETKLDSNFRPRLADQHVIPEINFKGRCLMKDNILTPKIVINLYISYTLIPQLRNLNTDFTLDIR